MFGFHKYKSTVKSAMQVEYGPFYDHGGPLIKPKKQSQRSQSATMTISFLDITGLQYLLSSTRSINMLNIRHVEVCLNIQ